MSTENKEATPKKKQKPFQAVFPFYTASPVPEGAVYLSTQKVLDNLGQEVFAHYFFCWTLGDDPIDIPESIKNANKEIDFM